MSDSRRPSLDRGRTRAALIAVVIGAATLTGCTSTLAPTTTSSSAAGGLAGGGEDGGLAGGGEDGGLAGDGEDGGTPESVTSSSTGSASASSAGAGSSSSSPIDTPPATPTSIPDPPTPITTDTTATPPISATYTPPVDADPVEGDCPYLTTDEAALDMSQRTGPGRIRPAQPQPVCEFVRADGDFLATIRVLQFGSDAEAVAAVDYYLPRDTTNPEDRPAGWDGGSLVQEHTVTYGVSKGTWAVIAVANSDQTVRARLLVEDTITNLAL